MSQATSPYVWVALAVALFLIYTLTYTGVRTYRLLQNSIVLVKVSKPYNRVVAGSTQTIVVLGDSTAVGTGATPDTSIAGRLGQMYPNASVYDFGINGLKLGGLLAQLSSTTSPLPVTNADIIILQIGANDITYLTPLPQVDAQLQAVLAKVNTFKAAGGKVLVLHSGLVGNAPLFPTWLGWLWNNRTQAVREIYLKDVPAAGDTYVDLVNSPVDAIFAGNQQKYYASDMFHPSSEGYGVWFAEVQKSL